MFSQSLFMHGALGIGAHQVVWMSGFCEVNLEIFEKLVTILILATFIQELLSQHLVEYAFMSIFTPDSFFQVVVVNAGVVIKVFEVAP